MILLETLAGFDLEDAIVTKDSVACSVVCKCRSSTSNVSDTL